MWWDGGNRYSPYISPPLRARRLDAPRSPGVRGVGMREGYVVEGGSINVARGAGVQAMEFRYDVWCVYVSMYYPGVVADVIALLFDQVLQAIPAHARVQYGLYFVFLFAFHKDWWGRGFRTSADDRVGDSQSELDDREDWVQSGGARGKVQGAC